MHLFHKTEGEFEEVWREYKQIDPRELEGSAEGVREMSESYIRGNLEAERGESCYIYLPLLDSNRIVVFNLKEKKGREIATDFTTSKYWVGYVHVRQYLFMAE